MNIDNEMYNLMHYLYAFIKSVLCITNLAHFSTTDSEIQIISYNYMLILQLIAGPKSWNSPPEDVTSSQSEYSFHCQIITTWLFKKSFLDIIV